MIQLNYPKSFKFKNRWQSQCYYVLISFYSFIAFGPQILIQKNTILVISIRNGELVVNNVRYVRRDYYKLCVSVFRTSIANFGLRHFYVYPSLEKFSSHGLSPTDYYYYLSHSYFYLFVAKGHPVYSFHDKHATLISKWTLNML